MVHDFSGRSSGKFSGATERHVVIPGTPEHRNTGTPEHPGTPRNTPEHPEQCEKPGTPRNTY